VGPWSYLLRALSQLVFLAVFLQAFPVTGQEKDEFPADEVESPSMHRQSVFWSPSAVTVITRDEILTSGANTIHDLLRRVPGMDVFDMKTYYPVVGARAMAGILGNHVLTITDGREEIMEMTGLTMWGAFSVDLEEIERIEVIRGPASVLYGANAYSAVVSIKTVSGRPTEKLGVFLTGGEQGHFRIFGKGQETWRFGDGRLYCTLRMAQEGKHSLSDFRDQPPQPRMHGVIRYREGSRLDLSLHGGVTGGEGLLYIDLGDLGFYGGLIGWVMGKGEFGLGAGARLRTQVYFTHAHSDFHYRSSFHAQGEWIADLPEMFWESSIVDGKVLLDIELGEDMLLSGGIQLRYSTFDTERIIVSDHDDSRAAAFANLQWSPLTGLQISGALRFEYVADTQAVLSPRAMAVLRPWPDHAFRLGYSMGFRKPSDFESRMHPDIRKYNQAVPEVVERMATQLGNDQLSNEKVHAVEAGWRGRFLSGRLYASVETFFNLYQDHIYFFMDLPLHMGVPDIRNTVARYQNEEGLFYAVGGEAELKWHPGREWDLFCNLGLRRVVDLDADDRRYEEPQLQMNFGGRFAPPTGMFVDLVLHYVSSYEMPLVNPVDPLADPVYTKLGDCLLLFGRAGYRVVTSAGLKLEAGAALRLPVGKPFREYAGTEAPSGLRGWDISDFGGEVLGHLLSIYFRGSF
jgi:outer membrane receptor protein involved in Fe transport